MPKISSTISIEQKYRDTRYYRDTDHQGRREGDKVTTPLPPEIPILKKNSGFLVNAALQYCYCYVFSFWEFTPRPNIQWRIQDLPKRGIVASARIARLNEGLGRSPQRVAGAEPLVRRSVGFSP